MPRAWFFAPYARRPDPTVVCRYCVMDDYTAQIRADGGQWSEAEVLGNEAIVKVNASTETLTAIAQDPRMQRIPLALLDEPLSSLTSNQRNAIQAKLESLGYSVAEIRDRLGSNLGSRTLRDVLRFVASRRLKPRYDRNTDTIVLDGPEQPCRQPEDVDGAVQ